MSHAVSIIEYAHRNNSDATTTHEYFTGVNCVQIQPSEALPLLTLSFWNPTPKLKISQATIIETMKQIGSDHSLIDIVGGIKRLLSLVFFVCLFFFYMLVSSKYCIANTALQSEFQVLIANHRS